MLQNVCSKEKVWKKSLSFLGKSFSQTINPTQATRGNNAMFFVPHTVRNRCLQKGRKEVLGLLSLSLSSEFSSFPSIARVSNSESPYAGGCVHVYARKKCVLTIRARPPPATPPTKVGKNNDCRRTNARTVKIIKYIIFLTGPSKSDIKKGPFLAPFFCHKKTRPYTLNKRHKGCN